MNPSFYTLKEKYPGKVIKPDSPNVSRRQNDDKCSIKSCVYSILRQVINFSFSCYLNTASPAQMFLF